MVDTTNDEQEKAIFHAARSMKDASQREAYLEAACGGDSGLRARVGLLLLANKDAGEFLESPAIESGGTIDLPSVADLAGSTIGPYKLLECIGEGGFGAVYMADQLKPIQRRVALKIIKPGMDTKQVIARFEAERQALALMDHPHIAKVLDAGATKSGHPFFVMELVRGIPVTEYCDDRNLTTAERLDLFMQVCSAIQHAHQKGIIHRDIKPRNILVSTNGDRPVPKVIDFGIAKATQGRLTDKTLFTQFRQFIGTPAYMSPEQAQMSAVDVDTRSDIYSLGVLLYELLTGKTPLDSQMLYQAGFEEVCRRIREEEAPKPSRCISSLEQEELKTLAKHRRVDATQFPATIRGDLDWIVMKAVEKDRTRRYATADALTEDLQRYLNHEPVSAAPPSALYILRRFAKRNRRLVAAVAAIILSLTLGLGLAIFSYSRERDAHQLAEKRRQEAVAARTAESDQRRKAQANERHARQLQYASDMKLAFAALERDIALTRRLLRAQKPTEAAPDLRGWEWNYLWQLCNEEIATIPTHASISDIVVSRDGKFLAVAGNETPNSVKIVDVTSRQIINSLNLGPA